MSVISLDTKLIHSHFLEEILQKLDVVTAQLDTVRKESAREVSILKADLESEKEARRGWQDKAVTLRGSLSSMVCNSQACITVGSLHGRNNHGLCLCWLMQMQIFILYVDNRWQWSFADDPVSR
jgi:hypothetical protein